MENSKQKLSEKDQVEDKEKHGDNVKEEEKKEDEGGKDDELILGGNFTPEFPDRGRPGDCQRCLSRKFTSKASSTHQFAIFARVRRQLAAEEYEEEQEDEEEDAGAGNPHACRSEGVGLPKLHNGLSICIGTGRAL